MPHTPGPWKTVQTKTRALQWNITTANGAPIQAVIVEGLNNRDGNAEDNARLIAAAPELLAALIDMTPYAYGCRKKHTFTTHSDCPDCQKAERARSIIKQAIGKQPEPDYEEPGEPDYNAPTQSERDEQHGNQYRNHER